MYDECLGCLYFGKSSDAPDSEEDDCMYILGVDDEFDPAPPCMRDDV